MTGVLDVSDHWGNRLSFVLTHENMTQRKLAEEMGISAPAVNKWISGGAIDYENLRKLGQLLCVNWVWLRYGDDALASAKNDWSDGGIYSEYKGRRETAKFRRSTDHCDVASLFCNHFRIATVSLSLKTRTVEMSSLGRQILGFSENQAITQEMLRSRIQGDHLPEPGGVIAGMLQSAGRVRSFRFTISGGGNAG